MNRHFFATFPNLKCQIEGVTEGQRSHSATTTIRMVRTFRERDFFLVLER